jgi:hypothetical protein
MLDIRMERIVSANSGENEPSRRARTTKMLTNPAKVIEISAVVSKNENWSNAAA